MMNLLEERIKDQRLKELSSENNNLVNLLLQKKDL